jgi:hypothetical protein
VNDACEGEKGDECAVGGETGSVAIDGVFNWADIQSAVCFGSEDDGALRHSRKWIRHSAMMDSCTGEKGELFMLCC